MRAIRSLGLMTIAIAVPFGAHADDQATKVSDLWDSGRVQATPAIARHSVAVEQKNSTAAVVRAPAAVRAVDTYTPRDFERSGAVRSGISVVPTPRTAPAATTHFTAAPEMNTGLMATGLTLLFGGVAVLRSRRTRSRAV